MAIFVSDEFDLGTLLDELDVFDSLLDEDSNYFINIKRLKNTDVLEFKESYYKINDYFRNIGILLKASKNKDDKNYRTALKMFKFSEVRGINLGFSKGKRGSGFGKILSTQIIQDAFEIIKSGSEQPEIFHLTSLFEENVGPDRLSDMIATLIYEDIVQYTKNIFNKVAINKENYPEYHFENGSIINPYKECELLLLPKDVLHELPIAKDWDDIDRVIRENETICREISEIVGEEWRRLTVGKKKYYIKKYIFMKPKILRSVVDDYNAAVVEKYDIYQNIDYRITKIINGLINAVSHTSMIQKNSFEASIEIIENFKNWIENQKGYSVLENVDTRNAEKIIQRSLHGYIEYYCHVHELDISPESNTGRVFLTS
jgi:hypothetical protein